MPTQRPSRPPSQPEPSTPQIAAARRAKRRVLLRRRLLALAIVAAIGAAAAALIASGGPASRSSSPGQPLATGGHGGGQAPPPVLTTTAPPRPSPPYAVGLTVLRLVDPTRTVRLPSGAFGPRTLVTYVRYPAVGPAGTGTTDQPRGSPVRGAGPFPLIVFGHGFYEDPTVYASLLRAWARAGYVVAAPSFPLSIPSAPGGANESDLPNEPGDMRFVISSVMSISRAPSGLLSGLVAPRVAVAGQSDGGDTALAVAYDPRFHDSRVGAAMILSGAEIPYLAAFQIQPGAPPLLAAQGTADPINLPSATSAFYDTAPGPKYLLSLLGASHLPPYTYQQPQLGIVERVTIAFLNHYLARPPKSLRGMVTAGNVPGVATISGGP